MNKKAFLLAEETLKIVVAVICIVFLAYFLTSLYLSKTGGEKARFANDVLNTIAGKINLLQDGDFFEQDIPNPQGWHLFGFSDSVKPNSCLGENCICICPYAFDYQDRFNRQQKKCDNKGGCLVIEELRDVPLDIKITGTNPLLYIKVEKDNGRVLISKK